MLEIKELSSISRLQHNALFSRNVLFSESEHWKRKCLICNTLIEVESDFYLE